MKSFTKGFLTGTLAAVAAVASGALTFHKKVIEPIEQEEAKLDENQRKATRKNRSAHQF
ncbi:DUF3042 family protein [Limosilactobacillus equigenerosi]|nr:DUF3042 family protein [Limosilactobacillus equigenerosi]MCQ2570589.1 DUF3042 family protein [Limosilactobacillus sp.]